MTCTVPPKTGWRGAPAAPHRPGLGVSWTAQGRPDPLSAAYDAVRQARDDVEATAARPQKVKDGPSAVPAAKFRLEAALRRLDQLKGWAPETAA